MDGAMRNGSMVAVTAMKWDAAVPPWGSIKWAPLTKDDLDWLINYTDRIPPTAMLSKDL